MRVVIRRISADGTTEDLFEGAEIIVGRSTDCTISLPGLLVALRHAKLLQASEYKLKLESLSPTGVELNGTPAVQTADVEPGDVIGIGGHRLRVSVTKDKELALEVELADTTDELSRRRFRSTLAEAGLSMRRPALYLVLATLVLGMLLPLALRVMPLPPKVAAFLPTDHAWLTGGMSNAHKHFGNQCGTCHETLFVRVRDAACLACHQNVKQHSDNPAIAHLDGIEGQRCAGCHREHQGAHGMVPSHPGICTECHASPQRFADSGNFADLQPVRDFGTDHPDFRPAKNASGLIFPHDVHLKSAGVRGPDGPEKLECSSCHRRDHGEAAFKRVVFATDCQRCHQLDVDVAGSTVRLPHGDNALARAALLNSAKQLAPRAAEEETSGRRRPGEAAPRGGELGTDELVDEIIGNRVCAKCHITERPPDAPLRTRPLQVRQSWMVHAHFTHEPHASQKCDDCHANQSSATSEDLALPSISSCRDCHGGVDSSDRLQSTCIDCHRFHEASRLVWGQLADQATAEAKQQ